MTKERYTQIIISLIVAGLLFATGFYFGESHSTNALPVGVLNATTTGDIDLGPFWEAWKLLDEKFAPASTTLSAITNQQKIYGAIGGLTNTFGDPYTVFFPPVESKSFNEEISGAFGGVGMEVGIKDGVLTVVSPLKGTPADNAGVKPGDKIISIGDKSTLNMSTDQAVKLIRGDIGTPIVITFVREGVKEPLVKTLIRANIDIPTINTKILPGDVFVIELYTFTATSPNLFRGALREFVKSGSDKLVLDLRNNPGGYLEAALDMASWFLPTGKTVVTENFGEKMAPTVYKSKGYDIFTNDLKFVILINEGSASASEILAGALSEYKKAVLVGTRSFGKGSVQELVPLTSDTSLKITVAHWFTPLGKSISNGGLTPDIEVKLTPENTKGGKDPQMDAAVKYLLK
ncbi:MAG: S41 family peptidase [Patescibacteria group bacterium]